MINAPWHWGLTPGERRALLLISSALVLGAGFLYCQRQNQSTLRSLSAEDSLALAAIRRAYIISEGGEADPSIGTDSLIQIRQPVDPLTGGKITIRLNLNSATPEQLESLPGIGPVLARRIVEERDKRNGFQKTEDLLDVPGIGPGRLETIRSLVTCSPSGVSARLRADSIDQEESEAQK